MLNGAHAAGVFNSASSVTGIQIALVNHAKRVNGSQIGLVNITDGVVKGTQIGLINVAEDVRGIPLCLINIIDSGFHVSAWYSELGMAYFGVQSGNEFFYTLFYGGAALDTGSEALPLQLAAAGIGLGLGLPLRPFYINADVSAKQVFEEFSTQAIVDAYSSTELPWFPSLRVTAGVRIFDKLAIFAGVMLDSTITGMTPTTPLHTGQEYTLSFRDFDLVVYPKLFGGIRL